MYRLLRHLALLLLWGSAQVAPAFDLLAPGDEIIAIDRDYDPPASSYPDEQSPAQAIDGDINTSYRNFAMETSALIITPSATHSQVEYFTVTTSATNVERDPETYTLYGTLDPVFSNDNGYLGSEDWTSIQSGSLSLPAARNTESEPILVPSHSVYSSYQIVFNSVKDSSAADSVQFAEIQFEAYLPAVLHVDASATGAGDGSSWQDAFADLPSALAAANAGTDLWVAEGVYHPSELSDPDDPRSAVFSLKTGVALYGGFSGSEVSFEERNIDSVSSETILSGDIGQPGDERDNSYRVVFSSDVSRATKLDGFTITGANSAGISIASSGLYIKGSSSLSVSNCKFIGNTVGRAGGAIYNLSRSIPPITSCQFIGNEAGEFGGAIYNAVGVVDCSFLDNRAGDSGGAIYNRGSANFVSEITNCSFRGNDAGQRGGAIHNKVVLQAVVTNSVFQGNYAGSDSSLLYGYGGAVFNEISKPVFISCTFQGNRARRNSGVFYNDISSDLSFFNCIIWDNQKSGGAGYLTHSIYDSIRPRASFTNCLVQYRGGDDSNLDGIDPAHDPLFVDPVNPADAPTSRGNVRLSLGSPAIGAGDNASNSEPLDLAGNPRRIGATIDMGAYELVADSDGDRLPDSFELANTSPPSATSLSPTDDGDADGLNARQEFAFGMSDLLPNGSTGVLQLNSIEIEGFRYQSILFRRNREAGPFLMIDLERSSNFGVSGGWSTAETIPVQAINGQAQEGKIELQMIRSSVPIADQARESLRLRVRDRTE